MMFKYRSMPDITNLFKLSFYKSAAFTVLKIILFYGSLSIHLMRMCFSRFSYSSLAITVFLLYCELLLHKHKRDIMGFMMTRVGLNMGGAAFAPQPAMPWRDYKMKKDTYDHDSDGNSLGSDEDEKTDEEGNASGDNNFLVVGNDISNIEGVEEINEAIIDNDEGIEAHQQQKESGPKDKKDN